VVGSSCSSSSNSRKYASSHLETREDKPYCKQDFTLTIPGEPNLGR